MDELLDFEVLVLLQLLFDGAEIHGLFDDLEVIWDHEFFGFDRLAEDPCGLKAGYLLDHSLRSFLPMVEYLIVVIINLWYLD